MPKRILVTGAIGFVGSLLCNTLKDRKDFKLITTDQEGNVDFMGDLSTQEFVKALPDVDVVVHCAAVQYHSKNLPFFLRRKFFIKNNVLTTQNLIIRYSEQNTHFVNIGSSMMYGSSDTPIKPLPENFNINGIYSHSKILAFEEFASYLGPVTHLIPGVIAGKSRGGLFLKLNKIIRFLKIGIIGTNEFKISIIHIGDFVNLIIKILEQDLPPKGILNASSQPSSVNDWVKEMAMQQDIDPLVIKLPNSFFSLVSIISARRLITKEQAKLLTSNNILDTNKTHSIGWDANFNLKDIIRDVISQ